MPQLIPVDAEALVVGYLREVMPDVSVATRTKTRTRQVTVEQTGGPRTNVVTDLPMLAIQCWGETGAMASKLCRETYAHLLSIRNHPHWGYLVREVTTFGGVTHFPDPMTTDAERYQVSIQLNLRPTEDGEIHGP